MGLLVTALVCTALIPDCPQAQARDGGALPPVGQFEISYGRFGGLRPTETELLVTPGRHALAKIGRPGGGQRMVRFTIGAMPIRSLERGLAAARFGALHGASNKSCADCYSYGIEYQGHSVIYDESTLPEKLRPVVSQLESLIRKHTAEPER